jgi:hypothetical protein
LPPENSKRIGSLQEYFGRINQIARIANFTARMNKSLGSQRVILIIEQLVFRLQREE